MIDFNCDMGEGIGQEAAIMPFIHSANISCGLHAGDEATIRRSMALALKHGVNIGAHPSFDDRANFGRIEMKLNPEDLYGLLLRQFESFHAIAASMGAKVHHVKPHGALYNLSAREQVVAMGIAQAVKDFNPELVLFGLSGSSSITAAKAIGLRAMNEVFAGRTYTAQGQLTPRDQPNALIDNADTLRRQVEQMISIESITATDGTVLTVAADTICIHSDGKQAPLFAETIYQIIHSNRK